MYTVYYSTHNNRWNLLVVRASLSLNARVTKSSIYFCVNYSTGKKIAIFFIISALYVCIKQN